MLIEADCLGSARSEHVERRVRRWCSAARLRLERVGATRPYQFGSNEMLYVERWKALSNLRCRLPLIADEFEHITISVFHEKTVPMAASKLCPRLDCFRDRKVRTNSLLRSGWCDSRRGTCLGDLYDTQRANSPWLRDQRAALHRAKHPRAAPAAATEPCRPRLPTPRGTALRSRSGRSPAAGRHGSTSYMRCTQRSP